MQPALGDLRNERAHPPLFRFELRITGSRGVRLYSNRHRASARFVCAWAKEPPLLRIGGGKP